MSDEPLATIECPLGGEHDVPGPDVRVLKVGDGGFVIACNCGDEPLEEAHEPPHPGTDHFGNVDGRKISPDNWLALEDAADGWYNTDPWEPSDEYPGTPLQRRQKIREHMEDESGGGIDGGERPIDRQAREVECPNCGANAGRKCQRPSGHRVRKCHSDRVDRVRSTDDGEATEQTGLSGWSE